MGDFVHLHCHTEYSLLDGMCRIKELAAKAASEGHKALAITDHGVMYGAVEFYRACKEVGVKPIIGCEVYVARRTRFDKDGKKDASGYHLVLLCKNETGYKNLSYLVSASFTEGFYQKPRIDLDLLREHSEGLIALSACIGGAIPQLILSGLYEDAEKYVQDLKNIFEKDSFYLEIQDHGLDAEHTVNRALAELSKKTGIPLVATNDIHYLNRTDAKTHSILLCVQTSSSIEEEKPFGFVGSDYFYRSSAEMQELFKHYEGACENTVNIADMCNFDFTFGKTFLPAFRTDTGESCEAFLRRITVEGFEKKISKGLIIFDKHKKEEYEKRLKYELSVIHRMGFDDYFLIVRDFVNYAKTSGIPVGPGRGSGAGSLVAFCIGITGIDSIKYDLLFERFLNPERVSLPDFDIDFCYNRRDEVINYVKRRYGEDHVAQIVTFGTMAARAAVRDVGRAMGMQYADVDRVAKLIPHDLDTTLKSALERKELKELYDTDENVRRLIDTAMKLEGMPRNSSTHAAGVVITEKPTKEYVPLSMNGDSIVTQYDMITDADLGLVKFDFLALRNLTIIDDAEKLIRENDKNFDIEKIPLNDKKTYALISSGNTSGVFQLEKQGMTNMLMRLRPENIEDIIAAIALYRPGPMESIPKYIARRHGEEKVEYLTPLLENVLSVTYGCIVYQEQVMEIFRTLAGYSFGRADIVRRAMAKKKRDDMLKERETFLSGCRERGISEDTAGKIFEEMSSFAEYAFNKSHAAAYATLSYRTAYLKANYPSEYMAALLTSVLGDMSKVSEYIAQCQKLAIEVLPPDINESNIDFTVVSPRKIRFGLFAIKNVGRPFLESLLFERSKRKFDDFVDFVTRMAGQDINKRQIESLIQCGCFDSLGEYRSRLISSYEMLISEKSSMTRDNIGGQIDIFSSEDTQITKAKFEYPDIPEFPKSELMHLEKESTGLYFSGKPLDVYSKAIESIRPDSISDIVSQSDESEASSKYTDKARVTVCGIISDKKEKKLKNGNTLTFLTLEDGISEIGIVVFQKSREKYFSELFVDNCVVIHGNVSIRDDSPPEITLFDIKKLYKNDEKPPKEHKIITIYVKVESLNSEKCKRIINAVPYHTGEGVLCFFAEDDKKYHIAKGCKVSTDLGTLQEFMNIAGVDNVKII